MCNVKKYLILQTNLQVYVFTYSQLYLILIDLRKISTCHYINQNHVRYIHRTCRWQHVK